MLHDTQSRPDFSSYGRALQPSMDHLKQCRAAHSLSSCKAPVHVRLSSYMLLGMMAVHSTAVECGCADVGGSTKAGGEGK